MAGYSDAEIETSVARFVKSDISVERDPLGPVDVANKFNEVLQLISSTLVFDPNAIFYLIYLASNRLNTKVLQAIEYLDDIIDGIDELGHRTTEVTRTSLLGDASAALLAVDTILTQSGAISRNAFTRYTSSVDSFIDVSLKPNIKSGSALIRPPQEARDDIRAALPNLSARYEEILATVQQLKLMLGEFNELNLPVLIIQDSVRKARLDLRELQSIFENTATTRDAKVAECRDAYLRLVSGKAVLTNLSTVSDPSEPRVSSTASLRGRPVLPSGSALYGEMIPASTSSSRSAPWMVRTGVNDVLSIGEDGNAPTTYTLVPPAFPSVKSYRAGTYNIHAASAASITSSNPEMYTIPAFPDNEAVIIVDGVEFAGNISAGTFTGAQIATFLGGITDRATGTIFLGNVINISYVGGIQLTYPVSGAHSIAIGDTIVSPIPTVNVNTVLGFTSGQSAEGSDANNKLEIDGRTPLVSLTAGAARTRAQIAADINTWAAANFPGVYTAADATTAVLITKTQIGSQTLRMTAESGVDDNTVRRALEELGFYEGQSDSSQAMSADEVADYINSVGKVNASIVRSTYEDGHTGAVSSATLFTIPAGAVTTSRANKTLVIRSGTNAGSYRIDSNSGTSIVVSSSTPFQDVGATNQSWAIIEDKLVLTSKSQTLSSRLMIGVATANTELGLTHGTYNGSTTGFRAASSGTDIDFLREDVVKGDILRIPTEGDRTILERSEDKQLEVSPPLSVYASNLDFSILSAAAVAYEAFIADLTAWEVVKESSAFREDISELDRVLNPLLVNKTPSLALLGDARSTAESLRELLRNTSPEGLADVLEGFTVARVSRMEASLNMLQERSLDRAYDALLSGQVAAFFGLDKDEASLSGHMLKSMRSVVQDDLPVSKLEEDADDIAHDEVVVGTDASFDFSDQDENEGISMLGEMPDLTDTELENDPEFYKKRY